MKNQNQNLHLRATIFPARSQDAEAIQKVQFSSWINTYLNKQFGLTKKDIELQFQDEFTKETLDKRRFQLDNSSPGMVWFVAKVRNKVIGVCEITKRGEKNELQAIYVLSEYQGVGNGALLWDEAKKHLDKDKKTIVKVHVHNTKAQSFYRKLGFSETGKHFNDLLNSGVTFSEIEMELSR